MTVLALLHVCSFVPPCTFNVGDSFNDICSISDLHSMERRKSRDGRTSLNINRDVSENNKEKPQSVSGPLAGRTTNEVRESVCAVKTVVHVSLSRWMAENVTLGCPNGYGFSLD